MSFHLWVAAVPALPFSASLVLAAFLAAGAYRRYARQQLGNWLVSDNRSVQPTESTAVPLVVCLRNGFTSPPVADKTAKPAVFGRRLKAAVSGPRKLNRNIIQGTHH